MLPKEFKRKVRATEIAVASATAEKFPVFIISISKNPRCFENAKHFPCQYVGKKKSWMNS